MGLPGIAPSVAFTCLLEFRWYAHADTRINEGLTQRLLDEWQARFRTGIDCMSLALELEDDLYTMQCATADRKGLPRMERP